MSSVHTSQRLGFAGTPVFAETILQALIEAGKPPVVVFTQPDRPFGRGRKSTPSLVKICAERAAIEVCQPVSLREVSLAAYRLDTLIVAAYGLIVPLSMLLEPRYGCLNVHASLLPRWRGAAPVERAIIAGDEQSGVSIMQMTEGIDTGAVYLKRALAIGPQWSGAALDKALARLGGEALLECLATLGSRDPVAQEEADATYAPKLTVADTHLNWQCSAVAIARRIRALADRLPVTVTLDDTRVRFLAAGYAPDPAAAAHVPGTIIRLDKQQIGIATGDGILQVQRLQLNRGGGRPLTVADAVNGYPRLFRTGARFDGNDAG